MKFTCLRENLLKGLNTVYKAVPAKGPMPVLQNFLIEAMPGRLKISATDLELAITTYVPASVEVEGLTTVPAKLLREFVSSTSNDVVSVSMEDDLFYITSEKTKSKLNGSNPAEYPNLQSFPEDGAPLLLDNRLFNELINSVAFSASLDNSRPLYTGILMAYEDGIFKIVAADGFRLSERVLDLNLIDVTNFSTLIPAKNLLEVAHIFASSTEPIKFVLNSNENMALFEANGTLISTLLLDGTFPDYKRIIPQATTHNVELNTQEILEAVKVTNLFIKDTDLPIKLKFDPEGFVHIEASFPETGDHTSKVAATVTGEALDISFRPKFLLDYLNSVKVDRICMGTNGSGQVCVLKPFGVADDTHLIMPISVS